MILLAGLLSSIPPQQFTYMSINLATPTLAVLWMILLADLLSSIPPNWSHSPVNQLSHTHLGSPLNDPIGCPALLHPTSLKQIFHHRAPLISSTDTYFFFGVSLGVFFPFPFRSFDELFPFPFCWDFSLPWLPSFTSDIDTFWTWSEMSAISFTETFSSVLSVNITSSSSSIMTSESLEFPVLFFCIPDLSADLHWTLAPIALFESQVCSILSTSFSVSGPPSCLDSCWSDCCLFCKVLTYSSLTC